MFMERDIRTVQCHLDTLSEHFEIERDDRSKPYGYRWNEGAKGIELPIMNLQESLILKLAHEHVRQLLPPGLMRSMEGFFEQAERVLGLTTHAQRERKWLSKAHVMATTQPLIPQEIDLVVFDNVTAALSEDRVLNLSYRYAAGEDKQSSVCPLGLAQQVPRMYLVCRFSGDDNERSLALHGISKAEVTNLHFDYPQEFELALSKSPLSKDQTVVEYADFYEVGTTVVNSEMLRRWLRRFGAKVWQIAHVTQ